MYYGATPVTLKKAKQLRNRMTPSEELLWNRLKGKQINGLRFRRQHPIDKYIVDFYCHTLKIVIEIDGLSHLNQKDYDKQRDEIIAKYGIKVLRYTNEQVQNNLIEVIKEINKTTDNRLNNKL